MHRRESSSSTVRFTNDVRPDILPTDFLPRRQMPIKAALWIHEDSFSPEQIVINPSVTQHTAIAEGTLVEITPYSESVDIHDFGAKTDENSRDDNSSISDLDLESVSRSLDTRCLCIVKFASADLIEKWPGMEISLTKTLAETFGFRSRTSVCLTIADFDKWRASHVELSFRDAYLARSDMWRLVSREIAGKTLFKGQKISFLGSMKVTVQSIHVNGKHLSTGYFSRTTIPVFRSEAARYILFIQMSREMWDFDSEGNGEIMFNKVINGFLPDLFRHWAEIEVRHMVSIILFGRMEYDRFDLDEPNPIGIALTQPSPNPSTAEGFYHDFYRVVVADMASAQWTTILNTLKRDFQIFLRDMSLHEPLLAEGSAQSESKLGRITGRPSAALKGNVLEAINMASSQFANDYIDRDLIRTGVSTVIITAGSGVFDVDRDLLNLTSESLTNNGIGIDVVCLSRMPLHSVPLFRYLLPYSNLPSREPSDVSASPRGRGSESTNASLPNLSQSPAYSSFTSTSANYFHRFPSAFPSKIAHNHGYGIPQWIDLSYWSADAEGPGKRHKLTSGSKSAASRPGSKRPFVPRVRMYELQMMGLMELGMADISIPYLTEASSRLQKRRRRIQSDLAHASSSRSLSRSPTYLRKSRPAVVRYSDNQGLLSAQTKSLSHVFDEMDKYDGNIFRSVTKADAKSKSRKRKTKTSEPSTMSASFSPKTTSTAESPEKSRVLKEPRSLSPLSSTPPPITQIPEKVPSPVPSPRQKKSTRISRNISYALRGLAPPIRATATAEVNVENVKALPVTAKASLAQAVSTVARPSSARGSYMEAETRNKLEGDTASVLSSDTAEKHSKPISIAATSQKLADHKKKPQTRTSSLLPRIENDRDKNSQRTSNDASPDSSENEDPISEIQSLDLMPDSIPRSTLPFIRNVNASNPLKKHPHAGSIFGRWQHLYPRGPHIATVKWRSLCTPASVPLTTDDFPSAKELLSEYDTKQHMVSVKRVNDALGNPVTLDGLLQEMIALRLAHGYQVVTGENVAQTIGSGICDDEAFLEARNISQRGVSLCMVMGNTVQKLDFPDKEQVLVTKYIKKTRYTEYSDTKNYRYTPNVRTILADVYKPRPTELAGFFEEYPWESADQYLASGGIGQDEKVQQLRFWRARFVLLPVEPPSNHYRAQHHADDNEEEIHLLGIRALTQMWQRARVFPQADRRHTQTRHGNARKKDQNPLEVKFDTLNPSEVVATELDRLLALEGLGEVHSTQLLPDSEKLDRESSMKMIAQAIQGDRGIEIKNRRWHFKLHYNCFHGEEFTNWLLHNVKSIETRDEAVEFGNEVMKEGLFEHVNGRHNFKDGHYFYSMAPEFRTTRLDTKSSWFGPNRRSDKSIPPTPLSEHTNREFAPIATRSRSGSSLAFQLNPHSPLEPAKQFADKKKKTVCLSKMIKIDVDPRKKSAGPEIINLHYDRLHNPENCYHIELNWLNVTSKLVDDAIVSWTNQAEKYGLKLVEVPIAEASEIPKSEPFRSVYRIKLALEPPKRSVSHNILTTNSFSPQQNPATDPYAYHKAILKRFNFVLDLEATNEFPENVEIEYSWGKLEYKLTQFVHRSGIGLAQISKEGDILLLANRLYNSRFVNMKDTTARFDSKKGSGLPTTRPTLQTTHTQPVTLSMPQMQATGIIGINVNSPNLSPFNATTPFTADVLGSKAEAASSTLSQFVTPEQIKDDIEAFCSDPIKLEQFYKDVELVPTLPPPSTGPSAISTFGVTAEGKARKMGKNPSTSSSLLRPVKEPTGVANDLEVPAFELPESVASPASTGMGISLGFSMLKRARGSVMYDSMAEMFGGGGGSVSSINSGNGSGIVSSKDKEYEGSIKESTGASSRAGSIRNSPAVYPVTNLSSKERKGSGTASIYGSGSSSSDIARARSPSDGAAAAAGEGKDENNGSLKPVGETK